MQINWFSIVYFVATIPTMLVALYVTDKHGFKATTVIGCSLNTTGSIIRLISTVPGIPHDVRYPLAMTGQTFSALAQPFVISLHTKISQVWFPEYQRTFATGLAAMGEPFGMVVGNVVFPALVDDAKDIPTANYVVCALGILSGIFGLSVRHSEPKHPPNIAAAAKRIANKNLTFRHYIDDLWKLMKNKNFMVLALTIGGGMGLISTLQSLMAQILCPSGYDNKIAGICSAAMVLSGFVGGGVYIKISEKVNIMEELIKIGFTVSVVVSIVFTLLIRIDTYIGWALALTIGIFGFLAMGIYPLCLETGVETSYPLDESFTSGFIVVSGQIQAAIFMPVMNALSRPLAAIDEDKNVCSSGDAIEAYDMTYSGIYLTTYAAILNCIMLIFFKPKYKRREMEKQAIQNTCNVIYTE
ncbi:hypothetical protein CHUAL_009696 [Chamberlinius hualienensis]